MLYYSQYIEDMFNICGRKFSLKTTILIFIQLITRLEMIHDTSERYFIHRDIKPDNFLLGLKKKSSTVHLIDFGLAKRFIMNKKTWEHIPMQTGKSMIGTARFASSNAHRGYELSRRDDLEALGYMMLYFYCGSLPWQEI